MTIPPTQFRYRIAKDNSGVGLKLSKIYTLIPL